jgi:glycosyltransferase involved in cell wall biosynthesis
MKVLFLNEYVQPGLGGGCESYLSALYKGLAELGHEVRIAGETWREAIPWADVVHINNMSHRYGVGCIQYCREIGKPYLLALHDYWPFCGRYRMAIWQGRNCLSGGCSYQCGTPEPPWLEMVQDSVCVTFSARAAAIFADHGIDAWIIPHGLDLDFWRPKPAEPPLPRLRVACISAWGQMPWKGVLWARQVQEILGGQAQFSYILGGRTPHQVRELYWWANVVLVPSVYEETFGLVAAEAQACGRPVAAFHVGGLQELATATAPEGDAEALAYAVSEAAVGGTKPVRSYQEMAKDYEEVFQKLI